jgi:opacity protein-like surface antigen
VKEKSILLVLLTLSTICTAQVLTPAAETRHSRRVTITYTHTFDDFDTNHRYDFDGGKAEFEQFVFSRVSFFGDFGGAVNSNFNAHYFTYRGGARYHIGAIHKIHPFAGAALGGANFTGLIGANLVQTDYSGFTWAVQAGADMPVKNRWGVRVKYEYQSLPFGPSGRDFWHNVEGGVSYRW